MKTQKNEFNFSKKRKKKTKVCRTRERKSA